MILRFFIVLKLFNLIYVLNKLRNPPFKGGFLGPENPPPDAAGAPRTEKTAQNTPTLSKITKKQKIPNIEKIKKKNRFFFGEGFF